jgi:hypothetical protein
MTNVLDGCETLDETFAGVLCMAGPEALAELLCWLCEDGFVIKADLVDAAAKLKAAGLSDGARLVAEAAKRENLPTERAWLAEMDERTRKRFTKMGMEALLDG